MLIHTMTICLNKIIQKNVNILFKLSRSLSSLGNMPSGKYNSFMLKIAEMHNIERLVRNTKRNVL